MSEQFKVGEIAILCNVEYYMELEGENCEIISGLMPRKCSRTGDVRPRYRIQMPDGRIFAPRPDQLRKRRPPSTGEQSILAMFKRAPQRNPVPA